MLGKKIEFIKNIFQEKNQIFMPNRPYLNGSFLNNKKAHVTNNFPAKSMFQGQIYLNGNPYLF